MKSVCCGLLSISLYEIVRIGCSINQDFDEFCFAVYIILLKLSIYTVLLFSIYLLIPPPPPPPQMFALCFLLKK